MADFMTIVFALRLRRIFKDAKDQVAKYTGSGFIANRKSLIKFLNPLLSAAYREGQQYASTWSAVQLRLKKKPRTAKIKPRDRKKILLLFIARVKDVEAHVKLKNDNKKALLKLQGIKRDVEKNNMIQAFYTGEIKKAVAFAIVDAGNMGKARMFEGVKK
jgi:hypothetical protein